MHLEDIDFRNCDPIEMIEKLKAFHNPGLEPLINWIARGYAFEKSNHAARVAIMEGEIQADRLAGKGARDASYGA